MTVPDWLKTLAERHSRLVLIVTWAAGIGVNVWWAWGNPGAWINWVMAGWLAGIATDVVVSDWVFRRAERRHREFMEMVDRDLNNHTQLIANGIELEMRRRGFEGSAPTQPTLRH